MKKLILLILLIPLTASAGTFNFKVNNNTPFDIVFIIVDTEGTVLGAGEAAAGSSGVIPNLEHGIYILVAFKKDTQEIGVSQAFKTDDVSPEIEITILSTKRVSI